MKKQAKGPKFRAPRFRVGDMVKEVLWSKGTTVFKVRYVRWSPEALNYFYSPGPKRYPSYSERILRKVREAGPARGRKRTSANT